MPSPALLPVSKTGLSLGWYAGQDIARDTFAFMNTVGLSPDARPGFVHLIHPDYSVADSRRDLYDHAFYRLSCAGMIGLSDAAPISSHGSDILSEIHTLMEQNRSANGGWSEILTALPPDDPQTVTPTPFRRQNPHMHHFEAAMALYDVTHDPVYLDEARAIYGLFTRYFFDPDHYCIREFFTEGWTYASGDKGRSIEPGHAAEWVWLLSLYERRTGESTAPYAQALYDKICKTDGFLNDEEDISGTVRRSTKRLWVQTELAKAHLAQFERGDARAGDRAAHTLADIETHYIEDRGTWIDQIDADAHPIAKTIPTSTFYHIIGMIAEAVRIGQTG